MQTINDWLSGGQDYTSGLALLAKYSKNRILLQNLSRKPIPEKLEYELRKLTKIPAPVSVVPTEKEPLQPEIEDPVKVGTIPKIDTSVLPDHLKKLWDETAEKYRLARGIYEKLKLTSEADQRAPLVEELENYRKEIRVNWDIIDSWALEQTKGKQESVIDEKRINANRKYLSEGKKAVMTLSGATRAKKLEGMQRRINELLSAGEKFDPENQKELEELGMKFDG